MSKIRTAFQNKKAFLPFITAGDPDLKTTTELVVAMEKAGADIIELGVPFSDPIADGVVIQKANQRALQSGITLDLLFEEVKVMRTKVTIPLVFLVYMNSIYSYGTKKFIKRCHEVGVDGIIVPDLPLEEREDLDEISSIYEVELISMIAPTSKERIIKIANESTGFLYSVSSLGVTGVRNDIVSNVDSMISMVRKTSKIPCAVGFGISTVEQAKQMAKIADGVIVGSAIVSMVETYGKDCVVPIVEYVKKFKKAINERPVYENE